jgi:7,8-dihydropterin-6-yl-methyl-4-(beta-D-ribofuranosyl)aminobenzene 5'-phosphate synthase
VTLAETADVAITIVVDNYSYSLMESSPGVERYGVIAEPLLAEHGLAVFIRLGEAGREILLDAGKTKVSLVHNLPRLGIDPGAVDQVVISHGHPDHTGALVEFLELVGRPIPIVVHPDAFLERWFERSDGTRQGPWQQDREAWEGAGAEIVTLGEPYELAAGCLATGPIPRRTAFEKVTSAALYRRGEELVQDPIHDDQAIVINVRGKGLVVVAGCAHSGIVNTVLYAQEISGVERVWAVLGGFHLGGAEPEALESTIERMRSFGPQLIMPCHCTGFDATCRFARELPGKFVACAVGTTLKF